MLFDFFDLLDWTLLLHSLQKTSFAAVYSKEQTFLALQALKCFLPNLPSYLSKDSVNYLLGPKEANSCRDWRCKVPNIAMRLCGPLVMVKKWVNDAVDKSCQRHQNSDHRNPGKWHSHQVRWMFLVFEVTFLAGNCWFVIEPFPNHGDVHVVIIVVIHCTRR